MKKKIRNGYWALALAIILDFSVEEALEQAAKNPSLVNSKNKFTYSLIPTKAVQK